MAKPEQPAEKRGAAPRRSALDQPQQQPDGNKRQGPQPKWLEAGRRHHAEHDRDETRAREDRFENVDARHRVTR
jgi:hypothetical protein